MSYSLFADLTQPSEPSQQFAATDLVHLLIQYVAHDVCALRRNTQVSFRIIDKARTIWTNINKLIEVIDGGTAFDWDSYDKFIAAIDPLEDALFGLSLTIEKEVALYLPESTAIDVGLQAVDTWKSNRQSLRDSLNALCNSAHFKALTTSKQDEEEAELKDIYSAYKHDDLALLSELYSSIEANALKIQSKRIVGISMTCNSQLNQIRTKLASVEMPVQDHLFILTISYCMLMFGVMEMSANPLQYPDWASYPKVKEVWKAANTFLGLLQTQLNDSSSIPIDATVENNPALAKVQAAYDDFVDKLKKLCPTEMPESFLALMKTVGKIRRPYYGQALAYVAICRNLAEWFDREANKTSKNVLPLQDAFDKTLDAFKDAVAAATSLRKFDSASEADKKAIQSLAAARDKLKQCFIDFKLEAWNEYDTKITTAITRDQERMNKLKTYQDDDKHAANVDVTPVETVDITIKPFRGSTAIPKEKTLKVRPDARLAAVRHDFCKYLDAADKTAAMASFDASRFKKEDGAVVGLDTEIKDIAQNKKCTLTLVIGPPDVKPKSNGI